MDDFLAEARARGFLHQVTDEAGLAARLARGPISGYCGFDLTADSLHVGSLIPIMLLRLFQRCGHRPVVLLGGGTTRVGDPSGKDESRLLLDDAAIARNRSGIRRVFAPFLRFGDGPADAVELDNADWLDGLGYIPFLRAVGRHVSVNRMLTMDSVRLRLDRAQPLSFLEFNYMLLQSYDFLELHRRHGVAVQFGGSDQWGNIVMGVDLVRRVAAERREEAGAARREGGDATRRDGTTHGAGAEAFGLTTPLLTTASGAKMGKTAAGAVWLSADRLAPYDYWQFWRNAEDADAGRFLALFTDLPMGEVGRLAALRGAEVNEAKKVLATEATALLHGRDAAEAASATARGTFEAGAAAADLPAVAASFPAPLLDLLVSAGFAASRGEARRLVRGGGARLNDSPVTDEARAVTAADLRDGAAKLSAGRKRHALVRPAG